jgi:antitoxin (DNA-binding transcriptional repressor) of toxin-antitoxin stability system
MTTIPLQEAKARLDELIHQLIPGDTVIITENDLPVARLIHVRSGQRPRPPVTGIPKAGRWEGKLVLPPDFDEPLEELGGYMA